uniref:NACHT, LRR and PYD domains-containing protein 1b allele 2-like n=1 Tax=Salmo trutta TaxID=8032 RepID=A0A673ZYI4_SALTR
MRQFYNKALDSVGTIITKLAKKIGVNYSESNMCLQKEFGLKTNSPKECLNCNHIKSSMSWIQVEPSVSTEDETTLEKSLWKGSRFTLKTSCQSSITPQKIKLRSTRPNYFEVYIKDAAMDFEMELISETGESAWKAEIRTEEYRDDSSTRDIEFVDEFRPQLIQKVNNVSAIADILFTKGMISEEINANISAALTRQAKMRVIYEALNSGGPHVKAAFFTALKEKEPFLVKDLDK